LRQYIELFKAENVTGEPEDWVVRVPYSPDVNLIIKKLGTLQILNPVPSGSVKHWLVQLKAAYPSISCNFVRGIRYSSNVISQLYGLSRQKYAVVVKDLVQSGIWKFYTYYYRYLHNLYVSKSDQLEYEDKKIKPFTMMDLKIVSVFIVWGILLGLAFFVLLLEYMLDKFIFAIKLIKIWIY